MANVRVATTDEEILKALPSAIKCCVNVLQLARSKGTDKQIELHQTRLYELSYRYVKLCEKLDKYTKDKNLMLFKI